MRVNTSDNSHRYNTFDTENRINSSLGWFVCVAHLFFLCSVHRSKQSKSDKSQQDDMLLTNAEQKGLHVSFTQHNHLVECGRRFGLLLSIWHVLWEDCFRTKVSRLSHWTARYLFSMSRFVPHCNIALSSFNLQFNKEQGGGLSFLTKIPKQFQDGFESYRKQYHARKKARQAKLKKSSSAQ